MFGLKKVYSSPKTNTVATPIPVVTSAFTAINDYKPMKTEIPEKKGYFNGLKSIERSAKIETLAYTLGSYSRPKEEPAP
jgi:hypothetical protein